MYFEKCEKFIFFKGTCLQQAPINKLSKQWFNMISICFVTKTLILFSKIPFQTRTIPNQVLWGAENLTFCILLTIEFDLKIILEKQISVFVRKPS